MKDPPGFLSLLHAPYTIHHNILPTILANYILNLTPFSDTTATNLFQDWRIAYVCIKSCLDYCHCLHASMNDFLYKSSAITQLGKVSHCFSQNKIQTC